MSGIASRLLTVISAIPIYAVFVVISATVILSVLIVPIPRLILSVAFLSAIIESSIRTSSSVAFSSSVIGAIASSIIWSGLFYPYHLGRNFCSLGRNFCSGSYSGFLFDTRLIVSYRCNQAMDGQSRSFYAIPLRHLSLVAVLSKPPALARRLDMRHILVAADSPVNLGYIVINCLLVNPTFSYCSR